MQGDLIKTFKIVNGHNMFDHSSAYHTRNFRVTSHLLTRAPSDFLSNRLIKYSNQLPSSVKHVPSVNSFKAGLDSIKSNKPKSPYGFWHLSE